MGKNIFICILEFFAIIGHVKILLNEGISCLFSGPGASQRHITPSPALFGFDPHLTLPRLAAVAFHSKTLNSG